MCAGPGVPCSLFIETDPIGTPNNFGFAGAFVTIDTDTGVLQRPATAFDPRFDQIPVGFKSFGGTRDDDVLLVSVINCDNLFCEGSHPMVIPNLGQAGPPLLAHGDLMIPPAPVGETFHASILIDPDNDDASVALLFTAEDGGNLHGLLGPPGLLGNTLTINVVPEPSTVLLMVGGLGIFLRRRGFHSSAARRVCAASTWKGTAS